MLIEQKNDETILTLKARVAGWTRFILVSLLALVSFIPPFAVVLSIAYDSFSPMILIGAFGWIAIIWFPYARIALWNLFGKEHLILSANKVSNWYDYKLYKTGIQSCAYDQISYSPDTYNNKPHLGYIIFLKEEKETFRSVLRITKPEFETLIRTLKPDTL